MLFALFGVLNARASALATGSVGGFEDDGNLAVDANPGTIDWSSVDTSSPSFAKAIDDTLDSGLQGSSKENSPEDWVCNTGGGSPGKANLLRAYVNTRITAPAGSDPMTAFLDMAFVRQSGTGDAHVNFEFNHHSINPCPNKERTTGDLLLTYDFPGGGGVAAIQAFTWDASLDSGKGDWVEFTLPDGSAAGTTNSGTVADPINGGNIGSRQFGEATVDLVSLDNATGGGLLACPGFGYVNVRSRSSGASWSSALQDYIPETSINLSTCGSVKLKKVDQNGDPLAGAEFGLFDNAQASNPAIATCESQADGFCKFANVAPGTYWVKEISAPTGYAIDDSTTHQVDVANFQDVDAGTFSDTFLQGFVQINKVLHDSSDEVVTPPSNPNPLIGTEFTVYQDTNPNNGVLDSGEESTLTDGTTPATCTITAGSSCVVGPLAAGSYRVAETVAPADSTSEGDQDFTITGEDESAVQVTYVNKLSDINIALDKSAAATANVGDHVTYSFDVTTTGPRLHDITLEELTAVCDSAPQFVSGDDGDDGFLEVGETWHYECDHLVVNGDGTSIHNEAKVTGTDDYGRDTSNTDTADVTVLRPDVTVTKDAVDNNIAAGDTAAFLITAHAGGDDGSIARAVTVTDTLPAGLTWTDDSDDCSIVGLQLTCHFGDMNKGNSASVTVSAVTSAANCGDLVNTAHVSASNELAGATENNDSDPATIHVACLAISINKDGPELAHVGDTITYSLEVTNSGKDALSDVVVTDPVCDTNTLKIDDKADGNDVLSVGEVWKLSCTHKVTATDTDPLPNTATVSGKDDQGRSTTDHDSHSVDIIHPAITIDKTVAPLTAEPGDHVTYSYLVKNTGDTPLHNVKVTDDKLGDIGTIDVLAPGESKTLTMDVLIAGDSPTDNVGTVNGTDELGTTVTANDTAHIDIVLPLLLARTGFDAMVWAEIGLGLVVVGFLLMLYRGSATAAVASHRSHKIKVRFRK